MGSARVWVRRRRDRTRAPWVVVYFDQAGRRRQEQCGLGSAGRDRADLRASALRLELRQAAPRPTQDPDITVKAYGDLWLERARGPMEQKQGLKRGTLIQYKSVLANHIYPTFGTERIRDLHQGHGIELLQKLLAGGELAQGTVQMAYRVMRRLFERARLDGLVTHNPMRSLWTAVTEGSRRRGARGKTADEVKAMSRAEISSFLAAVDDVDEQVLFDTKYRAGLRIGEVGALQLDDVDLAGRQIHVRRSMMPAQGGLSLEERLDTPKSGAERDVEIGGHSVDVLKSYITSRRAQNLREGWTDARAAWLFVNRQGKPMDGPTLRERFRRILKRARISNRYTPHCLRHSYATHMLSAGASLIWVSKQLGHSSPQITLDWYAWAIPAENRGFSELLDAPQIAEAISGGAQLVTKTAYFGDQPDGQQPQTNGSTDVARYRRSGSRKHMILPRTLSGKTQRASAPKTPANRRKHKGGHR